MIPSIVINGDKKVIQEIYVKVNGANKLVSSVNTKISGATKKIQYAQGVLKSGSNLKLDEYSINTTKEIKANATSITVGGVPKFKVGDVIEIHDNTNQETLTVTSVKSGTLGVSKVTKAYPNGARISRSTVRLSTDRFIPQRYDGYVITSKVL